MKLKLQTIITCLLLLISFTAKSQHVSIPGYDDHDLFALQDFFNQGSNASILGYNTGDPTTWTGVTWDGGSPTQKVLMINNLGSKNLTGTIDLSNFSSLNYVALYNNQLTAINVTGCTALMHLDLSRNKLTSLDVTDAGAALIYLDCSSNQISALDVHLNTALTTLYCAGNQIPALDVTKNTALTTLYCAGNQIPALDVSQNTALTSLDCMQNKLTALDVHLNTALTHLDCSSNTIPSLDVHLNTALTSLNCYNNKIPTLDVTKNTALTTLNCGNNNITALDVSANTALTFLNLESNKIPTLDVTKNTALTFLDCYNNKMPTLDVTKNTALTSLYCGYNQLTTLDVTQNTALTSLFCYGNELKFSDIQYSNTVTTTNLTQQRPFIPPVDGINIDTAGGTMAAATGATIDLSKETGINEVLLQTGAPTTFHVWKKAWDGTITNVTGDCGIDVPSAGKITLPASAGEFDSLFITMSNTTYPDFVEQTTPGNALYSGMRTRLFRIVGATFLPIELLSFTANLNNNKVDLAWSTASEKNNAFFTVERSVNNKDWENVAKINGAGNSNTQLNYSTIDENPLSGVSYYRLKQTDFDGKFEYSKTVVINRNAKTAIELYPNPATNEISVIGNEDDLNSIKIYNSLGQDVTKYTNYSSSNTKQITIDISKLTTGIYILKTKNTTNRLIVK